MSSKSNATRRIVPAFQIVLDSGSEPKPTKARVETTTVSYALSSQLKRNCTFQAMGN
ncbi:hypothetical protein HMPREF3198_02267 [Winkia neuii]|nr:hypothetical protein HMPREF3198_02267 [Winkia neuii]